jgi:hypothetical protein
LQPLQSFGSITIAWNAVDGLGTKYALFSIATYLLKIWEVEILYAKDHNVAYNSPHKSGHKAAGARNSSVALQL